MVMVLVVVVVVMVVCFFSLRAMILEECWTINSSPALFSVCLFVK